MGNYISCKVLTATSPYLPTTYSKTTRVILPNGEVRAIQQPTKAAELMMETPNFFVVNAKSLKMGQRFNPLNADDDLEKSNVYAMFPMRRKNSVVTAGDLGALFLASNSAARCAASNTKGDVANVSLEKEESSKEIRAPIRPSLDLEGVEEMSSPEFRYRMSRSRSKKPSLETIMEEQYCSVR